MVLRNRAVLVRQTDTPVRKEQIEKGEVDDRKTSAHKKNARLISHLLWQVLAEGISLLSF